MGWIGSNRGQLDQRRTNFGSSNRERLKKTEKRRIGRTRDPNPPMGWIQNAIFAPKSSYNQLRSLATVPNAERYLQRGGGRRGSHNYADRNCNTKTSENTRFC